MSAMEKIVTVAHRLPFIDNETQAFVCWFDVSVIDSSLLGTPRERARNHRMKITMSQELYENWEIDTQSGSGVSNNMLKVAFQLLRDEITKRLKKGDLPPGELSPLTRVTSNSEDRCPNLANIRYPEETEFKVSVDEA